jgi:alpha-L-fucosidase
MDEQLNRLKLENDFKKMIHNTNGLIKRHTDNIPTAEQLDDNNKGKWIEHAPEDFAKMFDGLLDYTADEDFYDNLDWNTVNYKVYDADYYEEKFPGFDPAVYEILAKSTEEENKLVDHRIPPLKVQRGEFTINFD